MADVNFKNFRKDLIEGSVATINGTYKVTLMSSEASFTEDDISISQSNYDAWGIASEPLETYVEEVNSKFVWKAKQVKLNGTFSGIRGALVHSELTNLVRYSDFGRNIDITNDDFILNFNDGILSI